MAAGTVGRDDVLGFRVRRHQLDRDAGTPARPTDVDLLDYGVQDTGPDGAAWALAVRGALPGGADDLAFAWTWRGAPHAYRRSDLAPVAVATAPFSEDDAARRIFDAARSLRAAGIPVLEALGVVAGHLRDVVKVPTVKGEASGRLTGLLDAAYLRDCRPCRTTHVYENLFRLPPLQAGLEIEPGTSPPVLRRIPRHRPRLYGRLADRADPRFHGVRNYLRFYGPARARDVAEYLDSPLKEVKANWPSDAVEVWVGDADGGGRAEPRFVLAEDLESLAGDGPAGDGREVSLLGPFDPYLQLRDRELLVPEETRRKELWPVLGRPGAVVGGGEVLGTWRPRTSARGLTVHVDLWTPLAGHRASLEEQAERLAAHRGVTLLGLTEDPPG